MSTPTQNPTPAQNINQNQILINQNPTNKTYTPQPSTPIERAGSDYSDWEWYEEDIISICKYRQV